MSVSLPPHQDPATYCHPLVQKGAARNCCIFSRLPLFKKQPLWVSRCCVSQAPSPSCSRRQNHLPRMVGISGNTCMSQTLGVLCGYSYNPRIAPLLYCPYVFELLSPLSPSPPCHCPSPKPHLRQVQGTGTETHKLKDLNSCCCSFKGSAGSQEKKKSYACEKLFENNICWKKEHKFSWKKWHEMYQAHSKSISMLICKRQIRFYDFSGFFVLFCLCLGEKRI